MRVHFFRRHLHRRSEDQLLFRAHHGDERTAAVVARSTGMRLVVGLALFCAGTSSTALPVLRNSLAVRHLRRQAGQNAGDYGDHPTAPRGRADDRSWAAILHAEVIDPHDNAGEVSDWYFDAQRTAPAVTAPGAATYCSSSSSCKQSSSVVGVPGTPTDGPTETVTKEADSDSMSQGISDWSLQ